MRKRSDFALEEKFRERLYRIGRLAGVAATILMAFFAWLDTYSEANVAVKLSAFCCCRSVTRELHSKEECDTDRMHGPSGAR
jgi:hypothetical protein